MVVELVAHVDDAVRVVEGARLACLVLVEQEVNGGVGSLAGRADDGTVEVYGYTSDALNYTSYRIPDYVSDKIANFILT